MKILRLICLILISSCLFYGALKAEELNTLTVAGNATVTVDPDYVILNFDIVCLDTILVQSKTYNDRYLADVENIMDLLNIPKENLSISNFTIRSKYDYTALKNIFRGYEVSRSIQLKLLDVNKYNDLLELLINTGISDVDYVEYENSAKESLFMQARENALIKAKEKAKHMASIYGMKIGKALKIDETSSRELTYRGRTSSPSSNVIEVSDFSGNGALGKYTVSANVTVVFELLDK